MIKLIACDIDGTLLLNGAKSLQPEIPELIRELQKQGRIFVAASGRQYPNLRRLFAPIEDEIKYICENGALIMDAGKPLFRYEMQRERGQEILKMIMASEGTEALLSGADTCYIQPKDSSYAAHMRDVVGNNVTIVNDILNTEEAYLKIAIYEKNGVDHTFGHWQDRFANIEDVRVVTSGNAWIDIIPSGINKGNAMQILGGQFDIGPDEMMAVGDNENDLEMLKYVSHSVAMRSGKDEARYASRYETDLVENLLCEILEGKYD